MGEGACALPSCSGAGASSSSSALPPMAAPAHAPVDEPPPQSTSGGTGINAKTLVQLDVFQEALLRLKPDTIDIVDAAGVAEQQMAAARKDWVAHVQVPIYCWQQLAKPQTRSASSCSTC